MKSSGVLCCLFLCTLLAILSAVPCDAQVSYVLGTNDNLDTDFASSGYDHTFNADTMESVECPKELNTIWWSYQDIVITVGGDALTNGLMLLLDVCWNDGLGLAFIRVDVDSGSGFAFAGNLEVNASTDGILHILPYLLAEGTNTVRLTILRGTANTTTLTWDRMLITSDFGCLEPTGFTWYRADTRQWNKEDWGGPTSLSRTQFQGSVRMGVDVGTGGYGILRTEYFPDENWESPVTGLKADVYPVGMSGTRAKLEPKDHAGASVEYLESSTLTADAWNTVTWTFGEAADYSTVARLLFVLDQVPAGGGSFLVDNIRLVTAGGDLPWEDFEGRVIDWRTTLEAGGRYDDGVDHNTNGVNEHVSHNQTALHSGGAVYLAWDANLDVNDFAKLTSITDLDDDWRAYSRIRARVMGTDTNAFVKFGFFDGANYLETPARPIERTNAWIVQEWDLPSGTFDWSCVKKVEPVVLTSQAPTGTLYVDEIQLFQEEGALSVSLWSIGRRDMSRAEFEPSSTITNYLVDYHCMLSYTGFPDRIADANSSVAIDYALDTTDAGRDALLTVVAEPEAGEEAVTIEVYSGGAAVGSVFLDPAAGLLEASLIIPASTLIACTNADNQLTLTKTGTGNRLRVDFLDLSTLYEQRDLFDALADDAAVEAFDDYDLAVTNFWMPLQTIHYTAYNYIYNYGANSQPPHRTLMRPSEDEGWMCLQRPTGQWACYPYDVYKHEGGNAYKMFVFDIDDWDWTAAEVEDQRPEFADEWDTLDHDAIPEWSRYLANVEIIDETPDGSGQWPWNCAARAVGYIKLTPANASHASSPRLPFFNVFSYFGDLHPDNEVQTRMPEAYFHVMSDTQMQVTAKSSGKHSVGAFEMTVGNHHTTEMGYHSTADIRTRIHTRRGFDVSEPNGRICMAGVASMFWKDEDDTPEDSDDQSHDNDMIMIARADGTFSSHELGQFPASWLDLDPPPSNNCDPAPIVFDLGPIGTGDVLYILQQDRNYYHYEALNMGVDYMPNFHRRASFSYRITHANKALVVKVYEGVPYLDTWDNEVIAIEVAPTETDVVRGDMLELDYELTSFVTPGVFITSPNTGTFDKAVTPVVNVTWEACHWDTNLTVDTISLEYSADGLSWTPIAQDTTNDGVEAWTLAGIPAGSYWLKITGVGSDGMVGWDVADEQIVVTGDDPAEFTPVFLGVRDDSEAEFLQDAGQFLNPYLVDSMSVTQLAKELNIYGWSYQDLQLNLDEPTASNGLVIVLSPRGTMDDKLFGVEVSVDSGSAVHTAEVVSIQRQTSGGVFLPGDWLSWGGNTIRLRGVDLGNNCQWIVWDQISLQAAVFTSNILVGTDDGSRAEFNAGGGNFDRGFVAGYMATNQMPSELNLSWWTNQQFWVLLDTGTACRTLRVTMDAATSSGAGVLNMDVAIETTNGYATVDNVGVNAATNGVAYIQPYLLKHGLNRISLTAESGTESTDWLYWDQVRFDSLADVSLTVAAAPAAHGSSEPHGYGVNWVSAHAVITNTVTSPADEADGTRYTCSGWTGSGSVPANGPTNVVVFTLTEDSVLTWNWAAEHFIDLSAGAGGTVNLASAWCPAGTAVGAYGYPDSYYHFDRWIGDTNGCIVVGNAMTVFVDQARSLTGLFAEDLATNGTPCWWLAEHGLTNISWDYQALDDADQDGMDNWQEWIAATVPTNADSALRTEGEAVSTNGRRALSWPSGTGRVYTLRWSTNLMAGFNILAEDIPATPPVNTYTDSVHMTEDTIYYDIKAEME